MGSLINDVRNHAFLEDFKTESLDTCIKMFDYQGRDLPDDAKEFILDSIEDLAEKFDIIKNYDLDAYRFPVNDEDGETEVFAKVSDVEEVFFDFRERLTTLVLQIVLYNVELYLAKKGYND